MSNEKDSSLKKMQSSGQVDATSPTQPSKNSKEKKKK